MPTSSLPSRRRDRAGSGLLARHRVPLRRTLAAGLAALAVGGAARLALTRPLPGTVSVVVASESVAVGAPLGSAVLEVRELPADAVPEGSVQALASVIGRSAASVLSPGEVVTGADLDAGGLLTGQGPGMTAIFLPLAEPAVLSAVRSGTHVDVHSPIDGSVAVGGALVLAVRSGEAGGVWLGVPPPGAAALAAARGADPAGGSLIVSILQPAN